MHSVKGNVIAIGKLIEQPKRTMHLDPLRQREFAQTSVASEQCPLTGFSDGEGERIWR
jgi:hypothetical protein